jgi:hypothetical protein
MGHRSEGGGGGDAEGAYQLMEPMTLDEIGALLVKASRKLSMEERKRLAAALLEDLRKPVGKLGRKK